MKIKQKIRGIAALGLLIFWMLSVLTGAILYFGPQGPKSGQLIILGFQKRELIQIHSLTSFLAAAIAILHTILEWPILAALIQQLFKRKE